MDSVHKIEPSLLWSPVRLYHHWGGHDSRIHCYRIYVGQNWSVFCTHLGIFRSISRIVNAPPFCCSDVTQFEFLTIHNLIKRLAANSVAHRVKLLAFYLPFLSICMCTGFDTLVYPEKKTEFFLRYPART